nr:MAG TPA: hypothetical protein [Caudoviricetes sp.]
MFATAPIIDNFSAINRGKYTRRGLSVPAKNQHSRKKPRKIHSAISQRRFIYVRYRLQTRK